jgi:Xaa-Pro aminopeptidase
VARPDPYVELYNGKMPTTDDYKERTGIADVHYHDRFDWEIGRLLSRNYWDFLYMDFHRRELDDSTPMPENSMAKRILAAHPYLAPKNLNRTVANMRCIKSADEVADIQKAIDITSAGIEAILRHMAPGVRENELQAHFEFELKKGGARENAFAPIVAAGKNSMVLHYGDNDQQLRDGDVLLLDLGAEFNLYSADISRTFPVNGRFTRQQRFFYDGVLAAQNAVAKALRPGLAIEKTLDIARDTWFDYCKEAGVAKERKDMEKLLPHGVCHYLGLDTHDVGDRDTLQPGMVLTIEPGVYLSELGFGIRIEDDALITADGCEILSQQILKDPDKIEEFVDMYGIKSKKERTL